MTRFLTGLAVGFGVGALLAPRSGEESREWLRSQAQGLWNSAREQVGGISEEVRAGSILEALNTVSRDKLMSIYGIGPLTADKIISSRPYDSEESFLAQRIVPESTFETLHATLLRMTA
jgi:hypothetical protein